MPKPTPKPLAVALDVRLMNLTAQLLFALAALLALGWLARWVAQQPVFAIRGLSVVGNLAHHDAASLRINALPHLRGGFFDLDLAQARSVFESMPWVRKAVVKRDFPNRLRVVLEEQQALAYWEDPAGLRLVNSFGEIFEANLGELEQEDLPRFVGPPEQSAQILAMYEWLNPRLKAAGLGLKFLALSSHGGWQVGLDTEALLQLGGGSRAEVLARTEQFLQTLPRVLAHYQRTAKDLAAADLRHDNAYAVRLAGVTTQVSERLPAAH